MNSLISSGGRKEFNDILYHFKLSCYFLFNLDDELAYANLINLLIERSFVVKKSVTCCEKFSYDHDRITCMF